MPNPFSGKRVLVAGGTGMIGIQLVKMLIELGASVRIASLDDSSRAHPEAEFMRKDLTLIDNCLEVCRGMDFVFNLLGVKASPGVSANKPARFLYSTVLMEMNMLEAAHRERVNGYLLTSSVGVYAPAKVLNEDDVWKTFPSLNDWYAGWSKRVGELQIDAYRKEYDWDGLTIVRPANVYGPYDNFESENAMVVPSLIKRVISGENPLRVWGDGTAVRDFIHAKDVASGMLLVAQEQPQKPVNLGSGVGVSIKDLVDVIILNLDKKPQVLWDKAKPKGDDCRILNISRAKELGFEPKVTLGQGIKETMDWYRANKDITHLRYDVYNNSGI
ncbi:MAG: NAD-dependent epimerase/dehydratase family protein [Candidatus Omnitrophica bacterium]|nr:NAD-dependent epimerase/dehydratase family protein [Candidatus Omnitrophota bacterium]